MIEDTVKAVRAAEEAAKDRIAKAREEAEALLDAARTEADTMIAEAENVRISNDAINVIAQAADGGMRDAQSLLDQLISFFGGDESGITEDQALNLFGLTAPREMEALLNSITHNDRAAVIRDIHDFADQGKNLETLFEEIISWLRGILLSRILGSNTASVLDETPEKIDAFRRIADTVAPASVQRLLESISGAVYLLRDAINKQVFLESILLKAMRIAHAPQIADLIARLNQIRSKGELAPVRTSRRTDVHLSRLAVRRAVHPGRPRERDRETAGAAVRAASSVPAGNGKKNVL